MNNIAEPIYSPCYYIDRETGTAVPGKFNYSAFQELLAQREAEFRANGPTAGTATLNQEDLASLAQQYNPTNMSQEDYTSLVDRLTAKGVLSRDEICNLGLDRLIYHPGFTVGGYLETGRPKDTHALYPADGNALAWTRDMARQLYGSNRFHSEAFRKVAEILEKMQKQRN